MNSSRDAGPGQHRPRRIVGVAKPGGARAARAQASARHGADRAPTNKASCGCARSGFRRRPVGLAAAARSRAPRSRYPRDVGNAHAMYAYESGQQHHVAEGAAAHDQRPLTSPRSAHELKHSVPARRAPPLLPSGPYASRRSGSNSLAITMEVNEASGKLHQMASACHRSNIQYANGTRIHHSEINSMMSGRHHRAGRPHHAEEHHRHTEEGIRPENDRIEVRRDVDRRRRSAAETGPAPRD